MMTLILATFLTAPATQPVQTAQFQPCVWPNRCATSSAPVIIAATPVTTCQWPNTCG